MSEANPWRVLVVDDDAETHKITELVLRKVRFDGRPLQFEYAFSGEEALEKLRQEGRVPRGSVFLP